MTSEEFRQMALSFPGAEESLHFDRMAFRVVKKRIFATLHEKTLSANLKLNEIDQSVFCNYENGAVYRVPNKWGLQGWTTFELKSIPKELMLDALDIAYREVFKKSKKSRSLS